MKILKNYLYNLSFQLLAILIPFITTPYVSRVLHPDGVGQYALSQAIAEYFTLVGMLGVSLYGMRAIAFVRDDKDKTSIVFSEINAMRFLTMGVSSIVYIIYVVTLKSNDILYWVQFLILLFNMIDISWYYQGVENFKTIALRNISVKVLGTIMIFIFVKQKGDVPLYAAIVAGTGFVGNLLMWLGIKGQIRYKKPKITNVMHHLKASFVLWIPTIAVSVYTYFDKVMLGWLSNEVEVGLYESAQKMVKIITTVTTSLSTVMVPQISNLFSHGEKEKILDVTNRAFSVMTLLSIPLLFGICAIRNTFVPWFFGYGFESVSNLLIYSSFLVLTLSWSSILGKQLLIGCNREKEYTIAVSIGAVVNLLLNFILIPSYGSKGATIASVAAEYTGMVIMMYRCRKSVYVFSIIRDLLRYGIIGLAMYFPIYYLGELLRPKFATTFNCEG